MAEKNNFHFELALTGDACVGKTAIILRFMYNYFDNEPPPTIGMYRIDCIFVLCGWVWYMYSTCRFHQ